MDTTILSIPALTVNIHSSIDTADDPETIYRFCELVKSPKSNVDAIFAGHVHYEH